MVLVESIVVCQQAYKSRESVLRLVSMKETHWKTMRILGISTDKHERTTLENHENINMEEPGNILSIVSLKELGIRTPGNILSILSLKEPGISTEKEPGISTEESVLSTEHEITTMESHENIGKQY
ncbi:hypothetical protein DPMN_039969 [Dreissena polymorpha]|uniref:Uncharacterized protein n=1 Tax=Dreissena polymorpha TaxID=45954 RepID=A0A9D4HSL5_DREPO|nr:hypothetical protein DPMN_039969 [Dreissena polymorpha]